MSELAFQSGEIRVSCAIGPDLVDITARIEQFIQAGQVREGTLHATALGSTASLTTIEFEPGAVADLKDLLLRLAPIDGRYAHEEAWHDGNGYSHLQAALLGPSIVVPIRNSACLLGTWQQIVLINHDNRARERRVALSAVGLP